MKLTILIFSFLFVSISANAQVPTAKLIKEKIANLSNHISAKGDKRSVTFHQVIIGKPVNWTMEYGNNAAADKNTKVYKVIATFSLHRQTFNTQSGKVYSTTETNYKRAYNFYVDKTRNWVCTPLGLSSGLY